MNGLLQNHSTVSTDALGIDEEKRRKINKKALVNKLNLVNFEDNSIHLSFTHPTSGRRITVPALPQPCLGEELSCLWSEPTTVPSAIASFIFDYFFIDEGEKLARGTGEILSIDATGIRLLLPETSYEISVRKARRYPCINIKAQIIQNSASFSGELLDYSISSFRVEIAAKKNIHWISTESTVNVIISKDLEKIGRAHV